MAKRPWRIFREIERPYTRFSYSKNLNKIPGAPVPKIRMFEMGIKNKKDWKYVGHLISLYNIQISDYSLEAVRTNLLKYLENEVKEFYFKIWKYPHQIIREHPLAYGAGADRISQGMRLSFGRPLYRGVIINYKDIILSIYFDKQEFMPKINELLRIASRKLSGKYKIYLGENIEKNKILSQVI